MRLLLPSAVALLSLSLVACDDAAEPFVDPGAGEVRNGQNPPSEFGPIPEGICNPRIVVAANAHPSCSGVGMWSGESLFGENAIAGLEGYCRYTYKGQLDPEDRVSFLQDELGTEVDIDVDCRAVTPQGTAILEEVHDELDLHFGWLIDRVTGTELANAQETRNLVDVAVVDTFPSDEPVEPTSLHGPIMMSLVEGIACPDGTTDCPVRVRAELGLPRDENGLNTDEGGVNGLQSDVAQGIYRALEAHRGSAGERLVINLSLGWESEHFGGTGPGNMPVPVRAVYDAIRAARCEGALVIASAGNDGGLSCTGVPMAPGRWEGMAAPTNGECSTLGTTEQIVMGAGNNGPLVYAIGGMNGANVEMPGSRALGMPRLAAAASHAVAQPRGDALPEVTVRTGTSVSSAVASAAASLVWSFDKNLTPKQVMQKLYNTGNPLTFDADFGIGEGLPVHRIDVCGAVQAVSANPAALTCDDPREVTSGELADAVAGLVDNSESFTNEDPLPCTNACGEEFTFSPKEGGARGCLAAEPDPWRFLTKPQPPESPCKECLADFRDKDEPKAQITLDDYYASMTLVSVDVYVDDVDGKTHVYELSREIDNAAVTPPLLARTLKVVRRWRLWA